MGAASKILTAGTMKELEKDVKQWMKEQTSTGILFEQVGWDPNRVRETENGYEIYVRART